MKKEEKRTCIKQMKLVFIGILIAPFLLALMYAFITSDDFLVKSHPSIIAKRLSSVREIPGLSDTADSLRIPLIPTIPTKSPHTKPVTKSVTSSPSSSTSATYVQTTTKLTENSDPGTNLKAVMLLTYMRSGSSLTGDILQQPDDAFYVFEPLKNAQKLYEQNRSITFLNGTVMPFGTYNLHDVYFNTLVGWFTCNLTRIYAEGVLDAGFLVFGNKFKPFHRCLSSIGRFDKNGAFMFTKSTLQREPFKACINLLQTTCLSSKYRITKTIRARMPLAEEIIMSLENSKVIHLVRDPRATLESKSHRGAHVCPNGIESCAKQHCEDVIKDTMLKENILLTSPKRIITIKYEDIATKPVQTSKEMYAFIEMDFTPQISDYVFNITLGYNKSGCDVCKVSWQIGQSNASSESHVDSWKHKMLPEYINKTQELCSDVITHYNYESFVSFSIEKRRLTDIQWKMLGIKLQRKTKSRKV